MHQTHGSTNPFLITATPLLRLRLHRHHRLAFGYLTPTTSLDFSTESDLTRPDETSFSVSRSRAALSAREPLKYAKWNEPDYKEWKVKEAEILLDIEPVIFLTKEILHSDRYIYSKDLFRMGTKRRIIEVDLVASKKYNSDLFELVRTSTASNIAHQVLSRYLDGEQLTLTDEKIIVEKLLAHHPHSEDKIGCGLDSIMVDRHPQFRHSRCLFVIRIDGGWIDFSYQKCLRAYVRGKYSSYADRFIREHFKHNSS